MGDEVMSTETPGAYLHEYKCEKQVDAVKS